MRTCWTIVTLVSLTVLCTLHVSSAAIVSRTILDGNLQSEHNLRLINAGRKDGQFFDDGNYEGTRIQRQISNEAAVNQTSTHDKNGEKLNGTVAAAPSKKSSVLILIRDALKKVTSALPSAAQQLDTTNALQYFTLFENFLQQTIEQVIGDDEEEEASTVKNEVEGTEGVDIKAPTTEAPTLSQQMEHDIGIMKGEEKPSETMQQIHVPQPEAVTPTNH